MALSSVSPQAASLSAINSNPQQERRALRSMEEGRQDAQQARQSSQSSPQRPNVEASSQTQALRQTVEAEASSRVREDQRTRPTVNVEGQLVGRKVNITA